jgi:hypothetical protein
MKSGNFGLLLRAFAEALDAAGAPDGGNQIVILASLFDIEPQKNVSEVLKRLKPVECSLSSRRPSAGETARLLPSIRQLFEIAKSRRAAADVEAVETLLRDHASIELSVFIRASAELLTRKSNRTKAGSRGKAPTLPLREDLVSDYQQRLEAALGDKDRFTADYEELCSNAAMGKDELVALAKRMTGAGSRSKDTALKKIWGRHQSLLASIAKSKATSGRSAA